ncbi:cytochrome P450 [Xylogone sp. PMI_703]|nr:cytochrome P450 [Xylogone sp. PMI_703]
MLARQAGSGEALAVISTAAALIASNILISILGGVSLVSTAYVVYQRFLSPLAKFPGPFWASLSPLWKLIVFRRGDFHLTIQRLHDKYGRTVRIAPNEVIIAEGEAIRQIYSTVEGRDFLKTDYYDAFTAFRPTIFGQRDPVLHAKRKRIVSHGYSMNALQAMEEYVQDRLRVFMDKMSGFASNGQVVNLSKWSHFFAFDVIGELAFSEGFGMLDSGVEDEHISLINNQMEFGSTIGMIPSLIPVTKWTWLPVPWLKRIQAGRERLKELTRSRVERRKEKQSDRKDLLGRLIEAKDPVTGEMLDPIDLRTEAFSSIVAGSDSTSSALGYTFYHILTHPGVQKTVTEELRAAFPDKVIGSEDAMPKYSELGKLPYLQACLKESLRLTPPATIHLPRSVPAGGKMIAGTYYPAGATVGISALPIHHNPELFGPDALKFNPDRWIHGSKGLSVEEMNKYWIPFGIGSRQCIGKNVALLELVKLVGTLLLLFDIELVKTGPTTEIPESGSYFFARMKDPVMVRLKARTAA